MDEESGLFGTNGCLQQATQGQQPAGPRRAFTLRAPNEVTWYHRTDVYATIQTLAGVAQWTEPQPANQRVTGSIPSQGTGLGCGQGSLVGGAQEATNGYFSHTMIFLSFKK